MTDAINLAEKFSKLDTPWAAKVVAGFNGADVMVLKLEGSRDWHSHPETDDLFYVLRGTLRLEFRDGDVTLGTGDMHVIPRGVEHKVVALDAVDLLLIETAGSSEAEQKTAAARERI